MSLDIKAAWYVIFLIPLEFTRIRLTITVVVTSREQRLQHADMHRLLENLVLLLQQAVRALPMHLLVLQMRGLILYL